MPALPSPQQPNGRGARSNATGRYEALAREAFDDGWTERDPAPPKLRTVLHIDRARSIIAKNDSPDIGFDQSINPYRSCEHGGMYTPVTHRSDCAPATRVRRRNSVRASESIFRRSTNYRTGLHQRDRLYVVPRPSGHKE